MEVDLCEVIYDMPLRSHNTNEVNNEAEGAADDAAILQTIPPAGPPRVLIMSSTLIV